MGMEPRPLDMHARRPELAKRAESGSRLVPMRSRQRRENGRAALLAGEGSKRLAWADFEQDARGIGRELRDAGCKPHRLPQVRRPITRVRRLGVGDPFSRHAGDEWDRRRAQLGLRDERGERLDDRVHHRGMEGVGGFQAHMRDVPLLKRLLERGDCVEWPGGDA